MNTSIRCIIHLNIAVSSRYKIAFLLPPSNPPAELHCTPLQHLTLASSCAPARAVASILSHSYLSMRHLQSSVEHLAAMAAATPSPAPASVHTDTFLIIAAVLCFLLCVVGLAFVARCSLLCNPSAYSVDAEPAAAMPPAPCKGLGKKALQSLPTVSFEADERDQDQEERPECAICLAEFARGNEVRVLPPCGHWFHAACVDAWLLSSSTCPSCRRALVVVPAQAPPDPPSCCASAQASTEAEYSVAVSGERGPCQTPDP
ncbi:RING-H2 finger protein ATL80-like [Phragmites australis]|uniref:RING-H2 finger protein ATL80-like n=1 Tax=Phragmites australis TaxID=29695 RepID=UPI002D7A340D|nr:RING-H2 finger protein ATL80-like [Phragmites australis]